MRRTMLGFCLLVLMSIACDDEGSSCQKTVEITLTFWDQTCWSGSIRCDGEPVLFSTDRWGDKDIAFCDNPDITCDEPEVLPLVYTFEWSGETCEYCSQSDGQNVCVPLEPNCETESHEITASGSEEEGPHPMVTCPVLECGKNESPVVDDDGVGRCECLPPYRWWDDFEMPRNPWAGIKPGPPVVKICERAMPAEFFEDVSCIWGNEGAEEVYLLYDEEEEVLRFFQMFTEGFALRQDGVGVNWYGSHENGYVIRLEFSLEEARFIAFDRGTGKLHSEGSIFPLSGPDCP
jgi:hypothetical protein